MKTSVEVEVEIHAFLTLGYVEANIQLHAQVTLTLVEVPSYRWYRDLKGP
jgi:hypothetical protein